MLYNDLIAEMRARIDGRQLAAAREKCPNSTWDKFFRLDDFLPVAAGHALRLSEGLEPNARVLDVGAGFGFVSLGLEILGFRCTAWDAPAPILETVAAAVPVSNWVFEKIERQKIGPMAALTKMQEFGLIFLHGVVPMRDAAGWWEWPDYAHLIGYLSDMLAPGGQMEWIINRGDQLPIAADPRCWAAAMEPGLSFDISDNVVTVYRAACPAGAV